MFEGVQGMDGGGEEIRMGDEQEGTSVVYSERFQPGIRGRKRIGWVRMSWMNHSFIPSFPPLLLNTCLIQGIQREIRESPIRGRGDTI